MGRSLGDPGLKPSVRVGEAAMREVAAFLLDHEHFASVPHTVMVKVMTAFIRCPKVAAGNDEAQLPLLMRDDIAGMESNYIATAEPQLQPQPCKHVACPHKAVLSGSCMCVYAAGKSWHT